MSGKTGSNRMRWIAGGALVVVAIGISVPVTLFTLPNVLPATARASLADLPLVTSPSARAVAAAIAFQTDQEPETLERVEQLADAAIRDEPLEVDAIRSLSFVRAYQGRPQEAMRLLRYGESLSKRDLVTELALAVESRRVGDDDEAIRHYGHALSTTGKNYDLLVEQVITATADSDFARELGRAMAKGPSWRVRFTPLFVSRNEDPASLSAWAEGMWANGVPGDEQGTASSVVNRLLRVGAIDEAARLIHRIDATGGEAGPLVRNGGFEQSDAGSLDWKYETGASLSSLPVPAQDGKGRVLEMRAGSGHLGNTARQTLALDPGPYVLSARLWSNGQADTGMPQVRLSCVAGDGEIVEIRRGDDGENRSADFTVPDDCPVQYIDVRFGSSVFVTDSRGYADDISIETRCIELAEPSAAATLSPVEEDPEHGWPDQHVQQIARHVVPDPVMANRPEMIEISRLHQDRHCPHGRQRNARGQLAPEDQCDDQPDRHAQMDMQQRPQVFVLRDPLLLEMFVTGDDPRDETAHDSGFSCGSHRDRDLAFTCLSGGVAALTRFAAARDVAGNLALTGGIELESGQSRGRDQKQCRAYKKFLGHRLPLDKLKVCLSLPIA